LRYSTTNFCPSLGDSKKSEQITAAFETWESVCGLTFRKVQHSESCEIKVTFFNNHDNQIDCPYKLKGLKGGTLAQVSYPKTGQICGDIHFGSKNWTFEKTKAGDGKYNLFSVAVHELGNALGIFHSNEKDSAMAPFHKHGFSTENKREILSERDIKLIQQMYGKPETIQVRAVYNSKRAKVMIMKIVKTSKPEKVKVVFTQKPRFFSENSGNGAKGAESSGNSGDSDEKFEEHFGEH